MILELFYFRTGIDKYYRQTNRRSIEMILELKETEEITPTPERKQWYNDPIVQDYLVFRDQSDPEDEGRTLTHFRTYYEIYHEGRHVGDIKIFYASEEDIFKKRAQILMVVGERNNGIGTNAIKLLLQKVKGIYQSVYCQVLRSNIASLKILKRNGFQVDRMDGDKLELSFELNYGHREIIPG
jgi:predicted acetyltransferase